MGRVYHPQTQEKIEMSHGAVIKELGNFSPMETVEEVRETVVRWMEFYNTDVLTRWLV